MTADLTAGVAADISTDISTGVTAAATVATAAVYTGRHRRAGSPRTAPPETPAWSKASRLLPVQVVVIAKEPVPGRVKTRLTPAFTPLEAAALAEASLTDTLDAVSRAPVARRVLALSGRPGRWLPPGFDVIGQRGQGLDERIAWALSDARVTLPLPVVLIGMDTPQVTPELLAAAAEPLVSRTADATFGMAEDGGFWLLGLREVDPDLILGVPMSRGDTGARADRCGHGPRGPADRRADARIPFCRLYGQVAGGCVPADGGGQVTVIPLAGNKL
jgi:glycosyltransferase A (GT-A) superfamily protein (DUF2064 family)